MHIKSPSKYIEVSFERGVLKVLFNRPEKKHAIDSKMFIALREIFKASREDDSVKCVLLSSSDENFSAGVDLSSFTDTAKDGEDFITCIRGCRRTR